MICRDRRNPIPDPSSVVVKNGMSIRCCVSAGIPGPLSATSIMTRPVSSASAPSARLLSACDERDWMLLRTRLIDKKNLLVVDNAWLLADRCEAFRRVLLQRPGITAAAFTQNLPGNDVSSGLYRAEGQDKSQLMMIRQLFADQDYLGMLGVKLHEGRFFSKDMVTDSTDAAVINQAASRQWEYNEIRLALRIRHWQAPHICIASSTDVTYLGMMRRCSL